jgi:hypothetical protein
MLAEQMDNNLVIADLGYRGEPVLTPVKKPPQGELSPAQINPEYSPRSCVWVRVDREKCGMLAHGRRIWRSKSLAVT